jgi:hypothetical protein
MRTKFLVSSGLVLATLLGVFYMTNTSPGTGQEDSCLGHGQLIRSQTTVIDGRSVEQRWCEPQPGLVVIIDAGGSIMAVSQFFDRAVQYYAEHPEEAPLARLQEAIGRTYVAPFLPLTAASTCDENWPRITVGQAGVTLCVPPDWSDRALGQSRSFGSGHVEVTVVAPGTVEEKYDGRTACPAPGTLTVPGGEAKVCQELPEYWGQGYGLVLPNGRHVHVNVYEGASLQEAVTAFRVAANVEVVP